MTATSADAAPIPASSLQVERLPIADLHPDPCNPRHIAEAELIAARRAGLTTVPVILLDLTAADARLLNVALNRIGGAWDQDLLARLLIDLQETTARDLTLSGFAEADLQDLLTAGETGPARSGSTSRKPWRPTTARPAGSPPAPAGNWVPIAFSGATPRTRHSSPAAWAANRRTWSSPTRPPTWPTAPMVGRPPTGPPTMMPSQRTTARSR